MWEYYKLTCNLFYLGINWDPQSSSAIFFAIITGHWKCVRYLLYKVGRFRIRSLVRPRRVISLLLLLSMHFVILGWAAYNIYVYLAAKSCASSSLADNPNQNPSSVRIRDWCAEVTGVTVLDFDYWSRSVILIAIILLTALVAHNNMPLHGVLLSILYICIYVVRARWNRNHPSLSR
jgi:hypothetical protein